MVSSTERAILLINIVADDAEATGDPASVGLSADTGELSTLFSARPIDQVRTHVRVVN